MHTVSSFHVMKELIKTDLKIFRKIAISKSIDVFIWVVSMILVFAYIMPSFGLSADYGGFMVASLCSSAGLGPSIGYIAEMVADFEGNRIIDYTITLPMPSWLVFVRLVIYYTIAFSTISILVLPVGKLLLWNSFSFAQFSFWRFGLIFLLSNIFYGVLSLIAASYVHSLVRVDSVWTRLIYPLWFFGCFQFSWESLYKSSPILAYINLLNPITYPAEGTRAAVLGQAGSLNFWFCAFALCIFIVLGGWHAIVRLKKRLDFV